MPTIEEWLLPLGQAQHAAEFAACFGTLGRLARAAEVGADRVLDVCSVIDERDRTLLAKALETLVAVRIKSTIQSAVRKHEINVWLRVARPHVRYWSRTGR